MTVWETKCYKLIQDHSGRERGDSRLWIGRMARRLKITGLWLLRLRLVLCLVYGFILSQYRHFLNAAVSVLSAFPVSVLLICFFSVHLYLCNIWNKTVFTMRMHSADYVVARCLSVRLSDSICPSVTRWYSVDTAEHILRMFYHHVASPF